MLHIFALTLSLAHAGWFADMCARFLVTESPYQFEEVSDLYLKTEIDRLVIRSTWKTITPYEETILELMRSEIAKRASIQAIINAKRPL